MCLRNGYSFCVFVTLCNIRKCSDAPCAVRVHTHTRPGARRTRGSKAAAGMARSLPSARFAHREAKRRRQTSRDPGGALLRPGAALRKIRSYCKHSAASYLKDQYLLFASCFRIKVNENVFPVLSYTLHLITKDLVLPV